MRIRHKYRKIRIEGHIQRSTRKRMAMDKGTEIKITSEMTVREVNMAYPQAIAIFEKYGIAGCGGKYGPPESLNFFAQAHKVDCDQLIADLEKAIQGESVDTVVVETGHVREESTLYRSFVKSAIVCVLTAGATWGLLIVGMNALLGRFSLMNLSLSQTHATVQVYGWVGLFIMGFAYHAIPRFKNAPLQYGQTTTLALVLVLVSLLTRFVSQPLIQKGPIFSGLLVSSGILLLIAYTSFIISMIATVRRAESETEFYEKFIVASLLWGFVSVLINLWVTLSMVHYEVPLIPPYTDEMLRQVQFIGFITMMVLGVSYRVLPGFLGVEDPDRRTAGWAFLMIHIGIILWLAATAAGYRTVSIVAAGFEFAGIVMAIASLNIFRPKVTEIEIGGDVPIFHWYVRLAFLWLVLGFVLMIGGAIYELNSNSALSHAFIDAYRHVIAMGFVTTILMGVAQRILPVWEGKRVYSESLMSWVFVLLLLGNLLRTLIQSTGTQITTVGRTMISGAGFLQFASIVLFSYNVWRTLDLEDDPVPEPAEESASRSIPERSPAPSSFDPKTKVFEILHEVPGAAAVLEDLGIRGVPNGKEGKSIPKFLTLERLCKSNGVELERVIRALEEYCAGE